MRLSLNIMRHPRSRLLSKSFVVFAKGANALETIVLFSF